MLTTPESERELIRSHNRGARAYGINGTDLKSVTSIISKGEPKPALIGWAKKVTAEAAIYSRDLIADILAKDGEKAALDYLKGAAYRGRDAAGVVGSKLHEIAELEILHGKEYPATGDPKADMLISHFRNFVEVVDPEIHAIEAVVYNETYGYAGTLDAIATFKIDGWDVPVVTDWKSGSGVYGSFAMQAAAYANAEYLVTEDGNIPMADLNVSTDRAAVIHITPTGWTLVEVFLPTAWEAFQTCIGMAQWADKDSRKAIGKAQLHGRATGVALKLPKKTAPKPDPEVVTAAQSRKRITPPKL
jgi:hypothetical protein